MWMFVSKMFWNSFTSIFKSYNFPGGDTSGHQLKRGEEAEGEGSRKGEGWGCVLTVGEGGGRL